ncbi:MAG: prefoldin subunit alpha [Thermoplasmatota archaeon]
MGAHPDGICTGEAPAIPKDRDSMAGRAPRPNPIPTPSPTQAGEHLSERDVQEAIAVGEILQNELRTMEEQRAVLDSLMHDLARGRETLEGLRGMDPGQEALLPIGGGVLVRAAILDPTKVLATVGAGVVIENAIDDAVKRLDDRINSAEQAMQRTTEEARRIEHQLSDLNERLSQVLPQA